MNDPAPLVSIGIPVFNGERFLEETLHSILAQTYPNFELLISDNASTDHTEEIGRAYAMQDDRIRYVRNAINLGASKNFNQTFALSSGVYFKWAAHDDVCAPDFLLRCVEALKQDPAIVLCYPQQIDIDEHGKVLGPNPYGLNTHLERPYERFAEVMQFWRGAPAIWGVMRRDILQKTPLIGNYYASDLVLLAELALYGRFHEVSEGLLLHRQHSSRSVYATKREFIAWLDPSKTGRVAFPMWRWFLEYLLAIGRPPLTWPDRVRCYLHAVKWFKWRWRLATDDLTIYTKRLLQRFASGNA